jgi:hypothetical protein
LTVNLEREEKEESCLKNFDFQSLYHEPLSNFQAAKLSKKRRVLDNLKKLFHPNFYLLCENFKPRTNFFDSDTNAN